jgi:hypothetical protein
MSASQRRNLMGSKVHRPNSFADPGISGARAWMVRTLSPDSCAAAGD